MPTIHLQGLGLVNAKPVETLLPGQKLCYNYSYGEHEVISVEPVSPQFFLLTGKNLKTGNEYSHRVKKGRLVGVAD